MRLLPTSLAFLLATALPLPLHANGTAHFDTLAEGPIATTFTDGGITFSNLWNGIAGSHMFVCENASTGFAGFPGFSGPNVLGFNGYSPGPLAGYSRFVSLEATTGQIEEVATVNAFLSAGNAGNSLVLEAWLGATVVASTSYTILPTPPFQQTQLALFGVPYDKIMLRGTGPHDGGAVFVCFDAVTLYYTPPIPIMPFCGGDGVDPGVTTQCPCANFGTLRHGCANSVNPSGAELVASGAPAADAVELRASGMPATVSCIYLQGDGLEDAVFGDGVRCAGGSLLRLRTKANVNGASQFPDSTDTVTLSQRGGVTPGSGAVRYYQTYYRNSSAQFCPPETFNVTNGSRITW